MTALQVVLSEEIHLQFRGECLHVLVVPRLVVRRNRSQNIVCDCVLPIQKLAKVSQYRKYNNLTVLLNEAVHLVACKVPSSSERCDALGNKMNEAAFVPKKARTGQPIPKRGTNGMGCLLFFCLISKYGVTHKAFGTHQ
jgi:hypothetical protein